MATPASHDEPAWLDDDQWLPDEEPQGVTHGTPDDDADQSDDGERVEVAPRVGVAEVLLALCMFVPQFAWMTLLGYLGYRVLT